MFTTVKKFGNSHLFFFLKNKYVLIMQNCQWIIIYIHFFFSVLDDTSVDKSGDLYIRSVCFSPDGKHLATGAEDKQIRVSILSIYLI
jgi:WD40 repeat protein